MEPIENEIQTLLLEAGWIVGGKPREGYQMNATFHGHVFDFQVCIQAQDETERFKFAIFHGMVFREALYSQLHFLTNDLEAVLQEMGKQKGILHKENYMDLVLNYYEIECEVYFEDADGIFFPLRTLELSDFEEEWSFERDL